MDDELAALCRREHPRLVGALSLHTGDALLAEELAQEALVRLCERWAHVSTLAAPGAWLHRVAMNLVASRFRRRAAERRAHARSGPEKDVEERDLAMELLLRRTVAALPRGQREAVIARFVLGLDPSEAGALLGIQAGAVRQRTYKGLAAVREVLDDQDRLDEREPHG